MSLIELSCWSLSGKLPGKKGAVQRFNQIYKIELCINEIWSPGATVGNELTLDASTVGFKEITSMGGS